MTPKGLLEGMDSNLQDYGFESLSENVKKLETKAKGSESPWRKDSIPKNKKLKMEEGFESPLRRFESLIWECEEQAT